MLSLSKFSKDKQEKIINLCAIAIQRAISNGTYKHIEPIKQEAKETE